ncbi:hypothetical protein ABIA54_004744 [Pseudomonas sp. EB276 TE3739]|nr:hypothetical protein [Pseudomonas koreensis]
MTIRSVMFAAPLLLVAAMASHLALANNEQEVQKPECPKGQVWDSKTQKCVMQTSSLLPDADRTDYVWRLARVGRCEEALAQLDTPRQPTTA